PLNRRHLLALGGTAAAVLAAALLLPAEDAAPPSAESPLAFPVLASRLPAAQRIELRQGAQSLLVQRGPGETWTLPQKGGYP
ncbi:hypothetical protein AB4142_36830, partial [Variovorax sp. 2RAF20]